LKFHELWAILLAGYFNKIRTKSFLVVLGLIIASGYAFVPAPDAYYVTLGWGSSSIFYRGVYNSAWIGAVVALLSGILLALFGFYIVNDNVKRDESSGVGQVIASTPISNCAYTVGNIISSFAILLTMVILIAFTAVGMQFFYGEECSLDLIAMGAPFIVFVVPIMLLVSSLALLFESIPFLRGTNGNLLYVFLWLFGVPVLSESFDLFGNNYVISSMRDAGQLVYPLLSQKEFILGYGWGFPFGRTLATFMWDGVEYSNEIILPRLLLICLGLFISLLASISFDRFDPDTIPASYKEPMERFDIKDDSYQSDYESTETTRFYLKSDLFRFSIWSLFVAELRLALNDLHISIYQGCFFSMLFIIVGYFLPPTLARRLFLPLVWVIPIFIWSRLGSRENQYYTQGLVFCSVNPVLRQMSALWLTGFFVSIVTGGGVALNLVLNGTLNDVVAWLVCALFIPSFALCSGVITGSGKIFEFIYLMLWYIGPLSGNLSLDFMASSSMSVQLGYWKYYLFITLILVLVMFVGRVNQIRRE
jgi:hypothetical protein